MKKIPTLFRRDPADMSRVTREVHPDCSSVASGEGVATRKYDGTCVLMDTDGSWWARREVKPGKAVPPDSRAAETDPNTGKTVDWEPAKAPRDWEGLREWLRDRPFEGIVWHHPDGRMAKLKRRDFPE